MTSGKGGGKRPGGHSVDKLVSRGGHRNEANGLASWSGILIDGEGEVNVPFTGGGGGGVGVGGGVGGGGRVCGGG